MHVRGREFWHGVRDEAPILLGVVPFGLIYGTLAMRAHLGAAASQAMSSVIFAGSAQFIAAQLFAAGASGLVVVLVILVVNLRHALYSASLAPHLQHLRPAWKLLLAYLLTDEAYAVAVVRYNQEGKSPGKHWYFLGAGLTLWACWQISTAIGIFAGTRLPRDWPLGFALPLTFIALAVPMIKDRAALGAALAAGLVGVCCAGFPFKTGLLAAAAVGILTGLVLEGRSR